MTYEQQDAHAHATAARYLAIGAEMSKQSGDVWITTMPHEHGARFCRADGLAIFAHSRWTGKESIHVGPSWPADADGSQPYLRDGDKVDGITIGTRKSDAQIARDMLRRLVGPMGPTFAQLTADRIATLSSYRYAREYADRVATAIGAEVWTPNGKTQASRHELIRVPYRNVEHVHVYASGNVEITINLPIDEAIALLTAQPRRAD